MTTQLDVDATHPRRPATVLTSAFAVLAGVYAAYRGVTWLRTKYLQGVWERRGIPHAADRIEAASHSGFDRE